MSRAGRPGDRGAILLAGGRSTRFGEAEKAFAPIGGVPMSRHVADLIAGHVSSLVVSTRAAHRERLARVFDGYPAPAAVVADPVPDRGPLAGVQAGLDAVAAGTALVVACDLPHVDPALVEYLFDAVAGHDAAVPRVDGHLQPTCAVVRTRSGRVACRAALAREDRRTAALFDDLDVRVVDAPEIEAVADPACLRDVDTRGDYEAALARLGGG